MPGIDYSPEPNRPKGMHVSNSPSTWLSSGLLTSLCSEIQSCVGVITARATLFRFREASFLSILLCRTSETKAHNSLHTLRQSPTTTSRCDA